MGGDEGDEGHEGHEGHEKEDRQQGCQEQTCEVDSLQRNQGEDRRWSHESKFAPEQERQDREQEAESSCQEEVRPDHWPLDPGYQEGSRGSEDQGILCVQEGFSALHQGKGAPQAELMFLHEDCIAGKRVGMYQLQVWDVLQLLSMCVLL